MNKRILYVIDENGNFNSKNYIMNDVYKRYRAAFLGGDKKSPTSGFVKSIDDDTTHIKIEASSHWKIKIKIKQILVKLGCKFDIEKRQPKKVKEVL